MVSSDVCMLFVPMLLYVVVGMYYRVCTTGYVIFMYILYIERNCIDGGFMNSLKRFKAVIL